MRHVLLSVLVALPVAAQSPSLLKDINTMGVPEPGSNPEQFVTVGSTVFFEAWAEETGNELYKIELPGGTPTLVKDIFFGPVSSNMDDLTAWGSNLVFTASEDATGTELYISDGTAAGTYMVKDIFAPKRQSPRRVPVASR